jgi:hypothetical protein
MSDEYKLSLTPTATVEQMNKAMMDLGADELLKRLAGQTWYTCDSTGKRWADDAPLEAAAALSEAQATIARLKDLLREAKNELERGWGTEDLTMACYREFESVMAQIDAELSPREGEGT